MKNKDFFESINLKRIFFAVALLSIAFIGFHIQLSTYMNSDGSNALNESRILFFGGKYFKDIFETTPPMFLYLNFPIIAAKNYFPQLSLFFLVFVYSNMLNISTTIFSLILLCKIFDTSEINTRRFFLVVVAFSLFIYSSYYTLQREAISFLFTLPYFLLFALRLKKIKISPWFSILIGICGGIGFSIKPHFCIPFLLTEIVLLLNKKKRLSFFRFENIIIYLIFISYLVSTYFLYPEYFTKIIPISMQIYYAGISEPFWHVFTQMNFIFIVISIFSYLLIRNQVTNCQLVDSITIGVVGYAISYILQFIPWFYHLLPSFLLTLLLNFLIISLINKNYAHIKSKLSLMFITLFFIIFNCYFYYVNFKLMAFFNLYFSISVLSLFTLLIVFLAFKKHFSETSFKNISVLLLGSFMFNIPIFLAFQSYKEFVFYSTIYSPIVKFLNIHADHKSVYFLTPAPLFEFPAVTYSNAISVSRFPYLVWLPALTYEETYHPGTKAAIRMIGIHDYFMKLLSDDIAIKKPHFIFVYASNTITTYDFPVKNFNLLALLQKNAKFAADWKNYHYYGTINFQPYYKLDIYELNNEGN